MHLRVPALFCLAFALELALKAVHLRLGMRHAGHDCLRLARALPRFSLTINEEDALSFASFMIADGKYVSPKTPDSACLPFDYPEFRDFRAFAEPIYFRLQQASSRPSPAPSQSLA